MSDIKIGIYFDKGEKDREVRVISVSPFGDFLQYECAVRPMCVNTCDVSWFLSHYEYKGANRVANIKLKRPIAVGDQSTHKKDNTDCEVTSIWINTQGQAVIESVDENNELSTDSVSSFINNYRKG